MRSRPVYERPVRPWEGIPRVVWRSVKGTGRAFAETKIGMLGLAVIFLFFIMAIASPILRSTVWDDATYDPVTGFASDQDEQPASPSWKHLLGTDPIGRDILSQLMASAASELMLGVTAALFTLTVGTAVAAISAYYGGIVDTALMRFADLIVTLPGLSLLIVLSALFELNLLQLGIVIGILSGFGGTAIVLKSQALSITVKPYIEAARVSGGGNLHIIFVHIVPNILPLSLLYMMFAVTTAILSEAVLSFFGILDIRMSWGIMVHTASTHGYLSGGTKYWWLIIPAGASITLLCTASYLVGRALDEVANPKLKRW